MSEGHNLKDAEIVIADDQPNMRDVVREILSVEGYHNILEAEDGVDCIGLVNKHRHTVKLLILDLGMPRLSGLRVIETLMEVHEGALGILVMSNGANLDVFLSSDITPCLHIHIEYIKKPFRVEQLRAMVQAML